MNDDRYPSDKMKQTIKHLQSPQPHFGGLITDPMPGRIRRLEVRVAKLEEILNHLTEGEPK